MPHFILPTEKVLRRFRSALGRDESWLERVDEDAVFEFLFEHLCYEKEAEMMLPVFASEVSETFIGSNGETLLPFLEEFGHGIYGILRDYQLYQKGILAFLYGATWGADLVVVQDMFDVSLE